MNFHTKAISKEKRVEERALFSCQFISKLKKGAWNYLLARGNVKKRFFDVNFCLRILSFASLLTQSVLFEQFMIFFKKNVSKKKIFLYGIFIIEYHSPSRKLYGIRTGNHPTNRPQISRLCKEKCERCYEIFPQGNICLILLAVANAWIKKKKEKKKTV